ncbi:DUF1566 domain-containing protein, partial [Candidatus Cryosericum hinesii]
FSLIPANTFAVAASDISGHWAQVKIQSWIDKGLIKGYPDGTFKPDQNVTRAEFMTLANRAFGYTTVVPITYTDVKAGSWYAPEVAKAKAAGYISGYPDGTMRPENPITREEVATIVARIKNLTSDANAADKYSDASKIGSWSKGQVGAVTSAKIMQGYPDGSFKPQGLMTRAEVVVASDNALYYTTPVANIAVSAITVTPTTMALTAGGATGAITATVGPSKATNKIVTWSSSNAAVATVAGGVVTPVAAGAAVITATTAQGSFTATCTVTVTAPAPAPATYTVTFDSQGGTPTPAAITGIASGATVTLPTAPTKTGYTFASWNTVAVGGGTTFDASTHVTANVTVYAQWTIDTFTLAYTAGANGTITGTSPQTVNYGTDGAQVTATPSTGYHFVKWSDDVATAARTDIHVTANISVTATFAIDTFTLAYTAGANGTISGTSPQIVDYGADGTEVTATPNTGYHFVKWSDDSTANPRTDTNVTGDITVSASFAANSGTITVAAGTGGSITSATSFDQAYGVAGTTITASPSAGYHFDTWTATTNPSYVTIATATDVSTTVTATSSMPATGGAATITATFAANSITVTIASAGNGTVTPTSPVTQVYGAGGTAITATPSAGYHFAGWSGTVNDTYVAIANTALASTTFTATTSAVDGGAATITATFAANTFAVTFDGQGGTPSPASIQVTYGSTYGTLATVTRTGYTFAGWWTLASGGTQVTSASAVSITAAQTLYAQWTADNETLTFNSNSGSPVAAITQAFGTTVSAPTAPTRSGCTFVAWYNESGFETVHTFSTMGLSTIVYAQWAATVTFDKNGGDNDASPTTSTGILLYSGRATLPTTNPTWAGHTFDSWNTQADGLGTAFTAATQVIATITVYAKWLSSDATLSSGSLGGVGFLGTSAGGTDIAPSSGLTVTVPAGMEALALTPGNTKSAISFTTSTGATPVDGGYNVLYVAGAQSIDLTAFGGSSADIWVRVTAEDRTTKLYYQIIVTVSAPLKIGDPYGGGKVAYILQSGETIKDASGNVLYSYDANVQHGLIAALTDQSTGIIWAIPACQSTGVTGTLDSIGYGSANTDKIIAQNVGGGTTYAAGLARACTDGGFNDWYLPSSSDLAQLYSNRSLIGNFNNALYYWSSYQSGATAAWTTYFATGSGATELKSSTQAVRAVRNF